MTFQHLIIVASKAVFLYAVWLGLIGLTYILFDQFSDWYAQFKQTRKNKAAKDGKAGQ
jgi:hypothetical protein